MAFAMSLVGGSRPICRSCWEATAHIWRQSRPNSSASSSSASSSSRIGFGLRRPDAPPRLTTQPAFNEETMSTGPSETFGEVERELLRRKRKADAKRRQKDSFVDHLFVTVRGGKGGNGAAAFAPSARGGMGPPCGGDGGTGGAVYLVTSTGLTSLAAVPKRIIGGSGGNGAGSHRHGKRGEDILLKVPVGTVVREVRRPPTAREPEEHLSSGVEEGEVEPVDPLRRVKGESQEEQMERYKRMFVTHPASDPTLADYAAAEQVVRSVRRPWQPPSPPITLDISQPISTPVLLASGGLGGMGNPHFPSATGRTARVASRGIQPDNKTFELELKLLADVGLVGLPNAGKSTLLVGLTGRKAEVAGYEFTTLNPQVGVVRVFEDGKWAGQVDAVVEESEEQRKKEAEARERGDYLPPPAKGDKRGMGERMRFTVSDNPGLLPLASQNVGLGHSFLRSIERSLALAFVVDLSKLDPVADLAVLREELETYLPGLSRKGVAVVLNKADEMDEQTGEEKIKAVEGWLEAEKWGMEVIVMSAKYGLGLERLVSLLAAAVAQRRPRQPNDE